MRREEEPRVLFVDDEELVVQSLKTALWKSAFKVETANSAREALAMLDRHVFDVIVSDERMPGMSGADLLAKVRRRFPKTVRIIFTGYSDRKATVRAINEGEVFRYLSKPCKLSDLQEALWAAMEFKQRLTELREIPLEQPLDQQRQQLFDELERVYPGITKTARDSQELIVIDEYEPCPSLVHRES